MLLLASTSDLVQIVTASSSTINVHASWVDNASGTITPGRTNTATISTNTTTTIVGSPASSTQRNVKNISIYNNHATVSCVVTINHTDGTNVSTLSKVNLLVGESLELNEFGRWTHYDAQGVPYVYAGTLTIPNLGISGTIAESIPRELCPEVNTAVGATGVLYLQAIYLKAGMVATNVILWSATTAAGTPTNYLAGLYTQGLSLLRASANQTTTAWAANTQFTFPLSSAVTIRTSGIYYVGFMMTATTVVTLKGGNARTGGQLAGRLLTLSGTSTTGLTTALPEQALVIGVTTTSIWAAIT